MNSVDIVDEIHTIAYQDDWIAYGIQLDEAPQLTNPSSLVIRNVSDDTLFTEVPRSQSPSSGQYRVDYDAPTYFGTGRIQFNPADNGIEIKVSYKGGGGIVKSRNWYNQVTNIPTNLLVDGDAQLESNLTVNGNINVDGNAQIDGLATFGQIPLLPAAHPATDNQATRKLYVDSRFRGYSALTLTHMQDSVVPAIAAGSAIDLNGRLMFFDQETVISTIDPMTGTTVVNGKIYIIINSGSSVPSFTATAPVWSPARQGWYGSGAQSQNRYVDCFIIKNADSYNKYVNILDKIGFSVFDSGGSVDVYGYSPLKLSFDTEIFNFNSCFSGGRFTPPRAGVYCICGSSGFDGGGSTMRCVDIYKNGQRYRRGVAQSLYNNATLSAISILDMAKIGDYYEIYAHSNDNNGVGSHGMMLQTFSAMEIK